MTDASRGLLEGTSSRARALIREINTAGGCSHPIRLQGSTVNLVTGEMKDTALSVACKDRRAVICPSCSHLYKADAWVLVATGLNGGKGVSPIVSSHPRLFITLTAPSFGSVHRIQSSSGRCHPRRGAQRCPHGLPVSCSKLHQPDDALVGSPLCSKCFDYRGAVLWNAHSSRLWNRTITNVRRDLARSRSMTLTELRSVARLNYLKVAELQHRGLLHFHLILRADGGEGPESTPPPWLTSDILVSTVRHVIETVTVRNSAGASIRWGSQHQIDEIDPADGDDRRAASYLAKYATTTTDGSADLARRFRTRRAIERAQVSEHLKTLVLTAWDLGGRGDLSHLNLRTFAHCLGFRGHLLTKSQSYSTTFGQLRGARADHQRQSSGQDPIEGSFGYVARGYEHPEAGQLADVLFEARLELKRARLGSHGVPDSVPNVTHNPSDLGK